MKTLSLVTLICGLFMLQSFIIKDDSFYEKRKATWEQSRKTTLAVANAMPEEKYRYSPDGEVRTFAAQLVHLAYSNSFIIELFVQGKQSQFKDKDASMMSKQEIIKMINESYDQVAEAMKSIKASELDEMVPIGGGRKITKAEVFTFAQDHVTNHRAKANLYIRLNKIKPPAYGF